MLASNYNFTTSKYGNTITIALLQNSTGRVKVFQQQYGCIENITKHMESLTDVQCAEYFKGKK